MQISTQAIFLFVSGVLFSVSSHSVESDISKSHLAIVNGYPVDIKQVPYHASLLFNEFSYEWEYYCGAVIISKRAVLTAAHCVCDYVGTPSVFRVRTSTSQLSGGKTYAVSKIYVHENYNIDLSNNDDIALLVTTTSITFNAKTNSVQIASPNMKLKAGTSAIVSGFGCTSESGPLSDVLLAAEVKVVDNHICKLAYQACAEEIGSGMLCANGLNPNRDACFGDSGGPLVTKSDKYLIGLVSFGIGCGNPKYAGVYTRVSEYHDWIQNKLKSLQ